MALLTPTSCGTVCSLASLLLALTLLPCRCACAQLRNAWVAFVSGFDMTEDGTVYISYGSADSEARVMVLPVSGAREHGMQHPPRAMAARLRWNRCTAVAALFSRSQLHVMPQRSSVMGIMPSWKLLLLSHLHPDRAPSYLPRSRFGEGQCAGGLLLVACMLHVTNSTFSRLTSFSLLAA